MRGLARYPQAMAPTKGGTMYGVMISVRNTVLNGRSVRPTSQASGNDNTVPKSMVSPDALMVFHTAVRFDLLA